MLDQPHFYSVKMGWATFASQSRNPRFMACGWCPSFPHGLEDPVSFLKTLSHLTSYPWVWRIAFRLWSFGSLSFRVPLRVPPDSSFLVYHASAYLYAPARPRMSLSFRLVLSIHAKTCIFWTLFLNRYLFSIRFSRYGFCSFTLQWRRRDSNS